MSIQTSLRASIKRTFRKRGYAITKTPDLVQFLAARGVDVVLDVGANVGQFASSLREDGYTGRIVSFEPIRSVFERLRERADGDAAWDTRHYALGAAAGTAQIHVSRYSVFSSILEQTGRAQGFAEDAGVVAMEDIEVRALDDFFHDDFGNDRVFLKIDVQGFEQQVLLGAARSLAALQGVQLEVPVVHLYHGTWSMEAALAQMRRDGFVIAQVRPVSVLADDPTSIVEIDCVFRRA